MAHVLFPGGLLAVLCSIPALGARFYGVKQQVMMNILLGNPHPKPMNP